MKKSYLVRIHRKSLFSLNIYKTVPKMPKIRFFLSNNWCCYASLSPGRQRKGQNALKLLTVFVVFFVNVKKIIIILLTDRHNIYDPSARTPHQLIKFVSAYSQRKHYFHFYICKKGRESKLKSYHYQNNLFQKIKYNFR